MRVNSVRNNNQQNTSFEAIKIPSNCLDAEEIKTLLYSFSEDSKLCSSKIVGKSKNPLYFFCGVYYMAGRFYRGLNKAHNPVYYIMTEFNSKEEKCLLNNLQKICSKGLIGVDNKLAQKDIDRFAKANPS